MVDAQRVDIKEQSPHTLETLANSPDEKIREEVAKDWSAPQKVLSMLAKDANPTVRSYVAYNENCPLDILPSLAIDTDSIVRAGVASNKREATPDMLKTLAKDQSPLVREAVAQNENTSPDTLRQLSQDGDWNVQAYVAANQHTPADALASLSKSENEAIRTTLANNPKVPADTLRTLLADAPMSTSAQKDQSGMTMQEVKQKQGNERVLQQIKEERIQDLAKNPNSPSDLLELLSGNEDWGIRSFVASNPNTSAGVLLDLASDENIAVQLRVANRKDLSPAVMSKLTESKDLDVIKAVLRNPSTSTQDLLRIAGRNLDIDSESRFVNGYTLDQFAHQDVALRRGVAGSPRISPATAKLLAGDPDWQVRANLASNKKTPEDILGKLQTDGDERVRRVALNNPETPWSFAYLKSYL